jgi:hypothetical protein
MSKHIYVLNSKPAMRGTTSNEGSGSGDETFQSRPKTAHKGADTSSDGKLVQNAADEDLPALVAI